MLPRLFLNDTSTGIPTFQEPVNFETQLSNSRELTDKFAVDIRMESYVNKNDATLKVMVNRKKGDLDTLNNECSSTVVYNILHLAKFVYDMYERFSLKPGIRLTTEEKDIKELRKVSELFKEYEKRIEQHNCPTLEDFNTFEFFSNFKNDVIDNTLNTGFELTSVELLSLKFSIQVPKDALCLVYLFLDQEVKADGVIMHGNASEMYLRVPHTAYNDSSQTGGLNAQVEDEEEEDNTGIVLMEDV